MKTKQIEPMFELTKTETHNIPKEKQVTEVIFSGTYYECLGVFHKKSSFSYMNHKLYSYTQYNINSIK